MKTTLLLFIFLLPLSESLSQNEGSLSIVSTSQVQFIVSDPQGRKTGRDPRGSDNPMQGTRVSEIPGARYGVAALGDSPVGDEPSARDLQFEFGAGLIAVEDDGSYTITTFGIELGKFSLFVDVEPDDGSNMVPFHGKAESVSDSNLVRTFHFTYNSASVEVCKLVRVVLAEEPSQDVETLQKIGLITDQTTYAKYQSFFTSFLTYLSQHDTSGARNSLSEALDAIPSDSGSTLLDIAPTQLRHDIEYLLEVLPAATMIPGGVSTYSIFGVHSAYLEQNSSLFSGDVGVNEVGSPPFLNSEVELTVGIGTSLTPGNSVKANQIKIKQGATVGSDVYYNTLDNNGTISGSLHTPLSLPLVATLPEFKNASPGTQNVTVEQNGSQTLQPGNYGDILVRRNGTLTFTGGGYHLNSFNGGDNAQILFQQPSEIRIAGKFDSDQGSYIGPQDTTTLTASQIVFYVGGINGSNGNLGATPKAAQIGISNTVKANFYVPNGTLWIRQNSEATGAFIGKDVDVGIGVKVWLKSAF